MIHEYEGEEKRKKKQNKTKNKQTNKQKKNTYPAWLDISTNKLLNQYVSAGETVDQCIEQTKFPEALFHRGSILHCDPGRNYIYYRAEFAICVNSKNNTQRTLRYSMHSAFQVYLLMIDTFC